MSREPEPRQNKDPFMGRAFIESGSLPDGFLVVDFTGNTVPVVDLSSFRRPEYTAYRTKQEREKVFTIGKTFGEYARQSGTQAIIYPDMGARLLAHAVNGYMERAQPSERRPETYFVHPQALQTREDVMTDMRFRWNYLSEGQPVPAELLPGYTGEINAAMFFSVFGRPMNVDQLTEVVPIQTMLYLKGEEIPERSLELAARLMRSGRVSREYIEYLIDTDIITDLAMLSDNSVRAEKEYMNAKPRDEIQTSFAKKYPRLAQHPEKKALIVDTCIHAGGVMRSVSTTLRQAGFDDIKIGAVSNSSNKSGIVPDVYVFEQDSCYPVGEDTLIEKQQGRIDSARVSEPPLSPSTELMKLLGFPTDPRDIGRRRRKEIKRIMQEHDLR